LFPILPPTHAPPLTTISFLQSLHSPDRPWSLPSSSLLRPTTFCRPSLLWHGSRPSALPSPLPRDPPVVPYLSLASDAVSGAVRSSGGSMLIVDCGIPCGGRQAGRQWYCAESGGRTGRREQGGAALLHLAGDKQEWEGF
jgi:hypothetical protein